MSVSNREDREGIDGGGAVVGDSIAGEIYVRVYVYREEREGGFLASLSFSLYIYSDTTHLTTDGVGRFGMYFFGVYLF